MESRMDDFAAIDAALASAERYVDLAAPLAAIAAAAGMTHYVSLRPRGAADENLVQIVHNAPASHAERCDSVAYWQESTLVQQLLEQRRPIAYDGRTSWAAPADIPSFEHGVAACVREERGACLLFLARGERPVEDAELMNAMRVVMLCAARMLDTFARLQINACPLSARQLDCLRHAMAGHTAAETARALNLSARTVEQYLSRARDHLAVPNSLKAAVHAIDQGWITTAEVYALLGT
jgi:DNA-binding CsgD family transcriptional regulator